MDTADYPLVSDFKPNRQVWMHYVNWLLFSLHVVRELHFLLLQPVLWQIQKKTLTDSSESAHETPARASVTLFCSGKQLE